MHRKDANHVSRFHAARVWGAALLIVLLAGCAAPGPVSQDDFAVLVMAHGGSPQWNQDVIAAVEPLGTQHNVEIAFGMADAAAMQESVSRLEARGARRIGVVRLFISGESFKDRTEQILGLAPGAPPAPDAAGAPSDHDDHGHSMALWRIDTEASFALSAQGLIEAPQMGDVLAERARTLSSKPQLEDVLILAHGPADDAENQRWLAHLEARADAVRRAAPFRRVQVETLREDWPEKRAEAERRIRAFVERAHEESGKAIVIPFRVQGFGPYAKVLEGLDYCADGRGLIPHPKVTQWLERQIEAMRRESFRAGS